MTGRGDYPLSVSQDHNEQRNTTTKSVDTGILFLNSIKFFKLFLCSLIHYSILCIGLNHQYSMDGHSQNEPKSVIS